MAGTVFFYDAALKKLLEGPDGPVAKDLARRAVKVETAAKLIATGQPKVQTGRYRTSINWRLGRDSISLFAEIGSRVPYALFLEFGTPPHIIRPRLKKALFWPGILPSTAALVTKAGTFFNAAGERVGRHPVALVRHPGTRAYLVLTKALKAAD